MRILSKEEQVEHIKAIRKIRAKLTKAREKNLLGEYSNSKVKKVRAEIHNEEIKYLEEAGIILYFGRLFKTDRH